LWSARGGIETDPMDIKRRARADAEGRPVKRADLKAVPDPQPGPRFEKHALRL